MEKIDIKEWGLQFAIAQESIFLENIYDGDNAPILLSEYNPASGNIEKIFDYTKVQGKIGFSYFANHHFFVLLIIFTFIDDFPLNIYKLESGNVDPFLYIESSKFPSDNKIDEWAKDPSNYSAKREYIRAISAFYETGNYLCMATVVSPIVVTLIHKDTEETYNFLSINDERYVGIIPPQASTGKFLVSYLLPSKEWIENVLNTNPKENIVNIDYFRTLDEESNPVLILYNFK